MSNPVNFSIITPTFNRAGMITHAIECVLAQKYDNVEHIIMDGGSTDGTLALLSAYPHLQVFSESDYGVYDGLNKGIGISKGEIIGQLNSDDYYQPDIFKKIADLFQENPGIDALCGSARVFEIDFSKRESDVAIYEPIDNRTFPMRITAGAPIFNAWFFRRQVFERIGGYSLEYPLMADRDFLIRCYLSGLNILPVNSIFYNYRHHTGSLTINSDNSISLLQEALQLANSYLKQENLNPVLKKNCMEWQDHTLIEMLIRNILNNDMREALNVIRNAMAANPLWLIETAKQIPARTKNYIKKHYAARN